MEWTHFRGVPLNCILFRLQTECLRPQLPVRARMAESARKMCLGPSQPASAEGAACKDIGSIRVIQPHVVQVRLSPHQHAFLLRRTDG